MTPIDSRITWIFGIILFINDELSKTNNTLKKEIKKENATKMIPDLFLKTWECKQLFYYKKK